MVCLSLSPTSCWCLVTVNRVVESRRVSELWSDVFYLQPVGQFIDISSVESWTFVLPMFVSLSPIISLVW